MYNALSSGCPGYSLPSPPRPSRHFPPSPSPPSHSPTPLLSLTVLPLTHPPLSPSGAPAVRAPAEQGSRRRGTRRAERLNGGLTRRARILCPGQCFIFAFRNTFKNRSAVNSDDFASKYYLKSVSPPIMFRLKYLKQSKNVR